VDELSKEYTDLVKKVQGVSDARVVVEDGQVKEVHVLGDTLKNPKQLVRDVETAFKVAADLEIDHRIISVVQFAAGENNPIVSSRPRLVTVGWRYENMEAEASVLVELGEKRSSGSARGANTQSNLLRLAGRACLEAVKDLVGKNLYFVLEDIQVHEVARQRCVLCALTVVANHREETLLGASFLRGDPGEAAARSVLNALNRKVFFASS